MIRSVGLIIAGAGAVVGCMQRESGGTTAARRDSAQAAGQVASTLASRPPAGNHGSYLPDSARTPGAIFPVTRTDICTPGYSRAVRNVPSAMKRDVYASYGITHHEPGEYEVDHLISLELGGSNSKRNLWPQSYRTQPWNARVKDALENRLHSMVCSGQISLTDAQHAIATDWVAAYLRYVQPNPPTPRAPGHSRR